ncbi:MAG TPA: hypothetical protein VMG82_23415 [Candidatus Sulfotelmatobacter sp.]|nr:hypothetical protein [Candidatus Sulfotelmatobacter sp.]
MHSKGLNRLLSQRRKVAVCGIGEVFALLYAYTHLADAEVICGFDDNRDRQRSSRWSFPVVSIEEAAQFGVSDVFLTLNPRYTAMVSNRLRALGLCPIPVLDGA